MIHKYVVRKWCAMFDRWLRAVLNVNVWATIEHHWLLRNFDTFAGSKSPVTTVDGHLACLLHNIGWRFCLRQIYIHTCFLWKCSLVPRLSAGISSMENIPARPLPYRSFAALLSFSLNQCRSMVYVVPRFENSKTVVFSVWTRALLAIWSISLVLIFIGRWRGF